MRIRIVFVVLSALISCSAICTPPPFVSYQGKLTDSAGQPVTGTKTVQFGLYDAPTAGSLIWSESQTVLATNGGLFNVLLGSVNPLTPAVFDSPNRYLAITIDGQELSPRQALASVPYALATGPVNGANIESGTITADKMANALALPQRTWVRVPYDLPLVAIHSDDISATDTRTTPWQMYGWFDASPALGGVSPAMYCAMRGVPITHGAVSDWIGIRADRMNINQIRTLWLSAGNEFVSQSKSHTTISPETVNEEIIANRGVIQQLAGPFTPVSGWPAFSYNIDDPSIHRLGLPCRGFSNPGSWADSGTNAMRVMDAREGYLGKAIYYTYEWALTYGNSYNGVGDMGRDGGWINASAFELAQVEPGTRTQVLMDGPTSYLDIDEFKTLIDGLVAKRDAGELMVVTDSTLHNAITSHDGLSGNDWGGLQNWSFDKMQLEFLPMLQDSGWYRVSSDEDVQIVDTSPGPGKSLKISGNGSTSRIFTQLESGQSHLLRIKAHAASGTHVSLSFQLSMYLNKSGSPLVGLALYNNLPPEPLSASGGTTLSSGMIYRGFGVPEWCRQIRLDLTAIGDSPVVIVDSVERVIM